MTARPPAPGWRDFAAVLLDHHGRPVDRHREARRWTVPAGRGHLIVDVTLRRRWAAVAVHRWHASDRDPEHAAPWFRTHLWPAVESASRARGTGPGVYPDDDPTSAIADPLDRTAVPVLLDAWLTAERAWRPAPARYDRTGEPVTPVPRHACRAGWLDRHADPPRPCPICRPWLADRRPPTRDELATARAGGHR